MACLVPSWRLGTMPASRAEEACDDGRGRIRHREQVTFDALDDVTGEMMRGRIAPADRLALRRFLASLPAGQVDVALEATTGWRFIVEELVAAGATAHLAEPAETANLRGR